MILKRLTPAEQSDIMTSKVRKRMDKLPGTPSGEQRARNKRAITRLAIFYAVCGGAPPQDPAITDDLVWLSEMSARDWERRSSYCDTRLDVFRRMAALVTPGEPTLVATQSGSEPRERSYHFGTPTRPGFTAWVDDDRYAEVRVGLGGEEKPFAYATSLLFAPVQAWYLGTDCSETAPPPDFGAYTQVISGGPAVMAYARQEVREIRDQSRLIRQSEDPRSHENRQSMYWLQQRLQSLRHITAALQPSAGAIGMPGASQ